MTARRHACLLAVVLALAACATTPEPPPAPPVAALTSATPQQMVAAIRAAGTGNDDELTVQPLRDAHTTDLRAHAARAETRGDHAEAAEALDAALAVAPQDPALLQERAEAALLLEDFAMAERLARSAHELGSRVGPWCRRHWATVQQVRLKTGDRDGADAAGAAMAACKVDGPNRY